MLSERVRILRGVLNGGCRGCLLNCARFGTKARTPPVRRPCYCHLDGGLSLEDMAGTALAHPVAGAQGEGPPVAPENWRWRCGNRVRDMYFYPPQSSKPIRSKTELAAFLGQQRNPPSPDKFCWKVTADMLKSSNVNWKAEAPSPKSPAIARASGGSRKRKSSSGSEIPSAEEDLKPIAGDGEVLEAEPLAVRAPGTIAPKKVTPPTARSKARAKKRAASAKVNEVPFSFNDILRENSSFMWLRNEDTMESFLQEASKLDEMPADNVREMRDILLTRNLQNTNLTKYPNNILRIFARILEPNGLGAEPSDSLSKVDLASLCVNLSRTAAPPA